MTLTHTNTNDWADSSGNFFSSDFDPKTYAVHDGLTDFGREVVLEMNRLGMLVDVSHVSDKTMADVIAVSKAPGLRLALLVPCALVDPAQRHRRPDPRDRRRRRRS